VAQIDSARKRASQFSQALIDASDGLKAAVQIIFTNVDYLFEKYNQG
jgi:hypothetical protein